MQGLKNKVHQLEKFVFYFLTAILAVYILIEIIELVRMFILAIMVRGDDNRLFISKEQAGEILGVFFSILIALELIETFSSYIKEHSIKVIKILFVGLIAIGRKLVATDFMHADGMTNIGLGALILAIALSIFFLKKGGKVTEDVIKSTESE